VAFLKTDDEISDFFMVRSASIKVGSNKKQYLDIFLADKSGEISAKKWDVSEAELPVLNDLREGDCVKAKGVVTEWNGTKQLKLARLRKAGPLDALERSDFVKSAPENPQDMYDYAMRAATSILDEDLKKLSLALLERNKTKLLYYPAASKNHHSERGGLLYHMKRMLMMTKRYCAVYPILSLDLLIAGVLAHDIEKLNEMIADEDGIVSEYSFEGKLLGHLVSGVKVIDRIARELGLPEEKALLLEHMVLSHHYEPEFGSPKRPMFPEAELLHYLDIVDARLYDMEAALQSVPPGAFSDKVRTLDFRTLYKPSSAPWRGGE
jgi:3'-5' exoribonuclease